MSVVSKRKKNTGQRDANEPYQCLGDHKIGNAIWGRVEDLARFFNINFTHLFDDTTWNEKSPSYSTSVRKQFLFVVD